MSTLTDSLRNAYDLRDRDYLERLLRRVDALERHQDPPAAQALPHPQPPATVPERFITVL